MLGLHEKDNQQAVVMYIKKGSKNITCDSFCTPGFAENFFGTREDRKEPGKIILELLRENFEGEYRSDLFIRIFKKL